MNDDYEHIFATLELDEKTLQMAHGETITPTLVTAEEVQTSSRALDALPSVTMELPAVRREANADFRFVETLGEGGMGIVSLAEQTALRRLVAIKEPKGQDELSQVRVLDEAFIMGRVEHPNVVPAYSLGRHQNGRPILVMKRVEGIAWEDILTGESQPPDGHEPDLAWHLRVLLQVCNALRFSHARQIVHRDIKPENVMIGEFGEVYLLDWGIALSLNPEAPEGVPNVTTANGMAGTPAFMAPEMTINDAAEIDERTDVYLLGANLHLILTGEAPHSGSSLFAVCMAAFQSEPKEYGDDVPAELAAIANRAMAKEKDERWQSVSEFSNAIEDYLEHRASYQLSDASWDLLRGLDPGTTTASDETSLLEAEFGFRQALTIWDGNERARDGLQAAIELRIRAALERQELGAARTALEQLPRENVELSAAVDALEAKLAERAQRVDYLEKFEQDLDLRTGTRARQRIAILLAVAFVSLNLMAAWGSRPGQPMGPMDGWMWAYWRLLAISAGGMILFWRRIFSNIANRRLTFFFFSALAGLYLVRSAAMTFEPPQLYLQVVEMVVIGMTAAAIGISTNRRLAATSIAYVVAALVLISTQAMHIGYLALSGAHVVFFGYMAWVWRPSTTRSDQKSGNAATPAASED